MVLFFCADEEMYQLSQRFADKDLIVAMYDVQKEDTNVVSMN